MRIMPDYKDGLTLKRDLTAIGYLAQNVPKPVYKRQKTEESINIAEARTRPRPAENVRRPPRAERTRENPPPRQTRESPPPSPRENLLAGKKIDVFA